MCLISCLPEGKIFEGFIVRTEFGHQVFLNWEGTLEGFIKLEESLAKVDSELFKRKAITTISIVKKFRGDKNFMKQEVLWLNKEAGLPGFKKANCGQVA